jgi:hypothetical protein
MSFVLLSDRVASELTISMNAEVLREPVRLVSPNKRGLLLIAGTIVAVCIWVPLYAASHNVTTWSICEGLAFLAGMAAVYQFLEARWPVFRGCPLVPRGLLQKWFLVAVLLLLGELLFSFTFWLNS